MEKLTYTSSNNYTSINVQKGSQLLLDKVFSLLKTRGFTIQTDQRILREYPTLADTHWEGSKGNLLFKAKIYPAGFELKFYQEVVTENPHGGYYDFDKFEKMPYIIRCEYILTRKYICELLESEGYINESKPTFKLALDDVMYRIKSCWHYKEGKELPEYNLPSYNSEDKDGKQLRNGQIKYFRDRKGRLMRGTIYHNINNMWWVVISKFSFTNVASFDFFDLDTEENSQRKIYTKRMPQRIRADKLRQKFKEYGLNYSMIDEEDLSSLRLLIARELKDSNIEMRMTLKPERKKDVKILIRTGLVHASIYVNGSYFVGREAITFNKDGFIGFAGWASDCNVMPFINAFEKWIETLKNNHEKVA
jgi:hypothetical protein